MDDDDPPDDDATARLWVLKPPTGKLKSMYRFAHPIPAAVDNKRQRFGTATMEPLSFTISKSAMGKDNCKER